MSMTIHFTVVLFYLFLFLGLDCSDSATSNTNEKESKEFLASVGLISPQDESIDRNDRRQETYSKACSFTTLSSAIASTSSSSSSSSSSSRLTRRSDNENIDDTSILKSLLSDLSDCAPIIPSSESVDKGIERLLDEWGILGSADDDNDVDKVSSASMFSPSSKTKLKSLLNSVHMEEGGDESEINVATDFSRRILRLLLQDSLLSYKSSSSNFVSESSNQEHVTNEEVGRGDGAYSFSTNDEMSNESKRKRSSSSVDYDVDNNGRSKCSSELSLAASFASFLSMLEARSGTASSDREGGEAYEHDVVKRSSDNDKDLSPSTHDHLVTLGAFVFPTPSTTPLALSQQQKQVPSPSSSSTSTSTIATKEVKSLPSRAPLPLWTTTKGGQDNSSDKEIINDIDNHQSSRHHHRLSTATSEDISTSKSSSSSSHSDDKRSSSSSSLSSSKSATAMKSISVGMMTPFTSYVITSILIFLGGLLVFCILYGWPASLGGVNRKPSSSSSYTASSSSSSSSSSSVHSTVLQSDQQTKKNKKHEGEEGVEEIVLKGKDKVEKTGVERKTSSVETAENVKNQNSGVEDRAGRSTPTRGDGSGGGRVKKVESHQESKNLERPLSTSSTPSQGKSLEENINDEHDEKEMKGNSTYSRVASIVVSKSSPSSKAVVTTTYADIRSKETHQVSAPLTPTSSLSVTAETVARVGTPPLHPTSANQQKQALHQRMNQKSTGSNSPLSISASATAPPSPVSVSSKQQQQQQHQQQQQQQSGSGTRKSSTSSSVGKSPSSSSSYANIAVGAEKGGAGGGSAHSQKRLSFSDRSVSSLSGGGGSHGGAGGSTPPPPPSMRTSTSKISEGDGKGSFGVNKANSETESFAALNPMNPLGITSALSMHNTIYPFATKILVSPGSVGESGGGGGGIGGSPSTSPKSPISLTQKSPSSALRHLNSSNPLQDSVSELDLTRHAFKDVKDAPSSPFSSSSTSGPVSSLMLNGKSTSSPSSSSSSFSTSSTFDSKGGILITSSLTSPARTTTSIKDEDLVGASKPSPSSKLRYDSSIQPFSPRTKTEQEKSEQEKQREIDMQDNYSRDDKSGLYEFQSKEITISNTLRMQYGGPTHQQIEDTASTASDAIAAAATSSASVTMSSLSFQSSLLDFVPKSSFDTTNRYVNNSSFAEDDKVLLEENEDHEGGGEEEEKIEGEGTVDVPKVKVSKASKRRRQRSNAKKAWAALNNQLMMYQQALGGGVTNWSGGGESALSSNMSTDINNNNTLATADGGYPNSSLPLSMSNSSLSSIDPSMMMMMMPAGNSVSPVSSSSFTPLNTAQVSTSATPSTSILSGMTKSHSASSLASFSSTGSLSRRQRRAAARAAAAASGIPFSAAKQSGIANFLQAMGFAGGNGGGGGASAMPIGAFNFNFVPNSGGSGGGAISSSPSHNALAALFAEQITAMGIDASSLAMLASSLGSKSEGGGGSGQGSSYPSQQGGDLNAALASAMSMFFAQQQQQQQQQQSGIGMQNIPSSIQNNNIQHTSSSMSNNTIALSEPLFLKSASSSPANPHSSPSDLRGGGGGGSGLLSSSSRSSNSSTGTGGAGSGSGGVIFSVESLPSSLGPTRSSSMLNLEARGNSDAGTLSSSSVADEGFVGGGGMRRSGSETQQKDAMLAARRLLLIPWYQQKLTNGELTAITDRLAEGLMQQPPDPASTVALSGIAEGLPVQEALERAGILPKSATSAPTAALMSSSSSSSSSSPSVLRPSNSLHNMLAGLGESPSSSSSYTLRQHSHQQNLGGNSSPWGASSPSSVVTSPSGGGGGGIRRSSATNNQLMNSSTDLTREDYLVQNGSLLSSSSSDALTRESITLNNNTTSGTAIMHRPLETTLNKETAAAALSWAQQALSAVSFMRDNEQSLRNGGKADITKRKGDRGDLEEDAGDDDDDDEARFRKKAEFDFLSDDDDDDDDEDDDDDDDDNDESDRDDDAKHT